MFSTDEYTPAQFMTLMRHTQEASSRARREALENNPRRLESGGTSVRRDSQGRQIHTLFCGSEQPFTTAHLNQASSGVNALSASLGIQNSAPQRAQLAQKSNGCGTQIHHAASPEIWVWNADANGVSDTVVPLEDQYVPPETAAELEAPRQEACGCVTEFVGCAVCGNPLGSQLVPCQTHTLPNWSGAYTFLPTAVSPPLSNLTTPVPADRGWEHERERLAERLRSRANYAPDGRRIPREPPPLRSRLARRPAPESENTATTRALVRASLRRTETATIEEEWVAAHQRAVATVQSQAEPPRGYSLPSAASLGADTYRTALRGEQVLAPNTPAPTTTAAPTSTPTSAVRDRAHPVVQFLGTATSTDVNSESNPWSLFEPDGSLRLPPTQRLSPVELIVQQQQRTRQERLTRTHQDQLAQEQMYQEQLLLQEGPRLRQAPLPMAGMGLPAGATTRVLRVGRVSGRAGRAGAGSVGPGGAGAGGGRTIVVDTDSGSDWEYEPNVLLRAV